jgi:O-antigen ligase
MYANFSPAILTTFSAVLIAISMTFSPFLLSLGMWLLIASAVWHLRKENTCGWGQLWIISWQRWTAQPELVVLSLLFWIVALSGLWSDDLNFWLARTRIRLPFLFLPWAFANLPRLPTKQLYAVPYYLTWSLLILCLGIAANFITDPETILLGLSEGQPIPVPRSHIRFNLMLVVAVVSGGWLWTQRSYWESNKQRNLFGGVIIVLFLFIHFLAVRSGLMALYGALFISVIWWIVQTRRWAWGVAGLIGLLALPVAAWLALPSLQNRIYYMMNDWDHYQSQSGGESYSDSERFISLHVGYAIWKDHVTIGIGAGDLERATLEKTHALYPIYEESPKLPHNQILYVLAGTGLVGLLASLVAWLFPWRLVRYRNCYLWVSFQVIIGISFLVEYTLETSIGAAFYLFYQLWWMKIARENPSGT